MNNRVQFMGAVLVMSIFALMSACDKTGSLESPPPRIQSTSILANPQNALAAFLTVRTANVDSLRVRITSDGDAQMLTPAVPSTGPATTIPILGLRGATAYRFTAEAFGAHGNSDTSSLAFSSGALPAPIKDIRLVGTGAGSGGYTLLTPLAFNGDTVGYVLAFDTAGVLRWYRAFHEGIPAVEAKQQPNGNFTIYLGASHGAEPVIGRYAEINPSGEELHSYSAAAPFYTDAHEMQLLFDARGNVAHVLLFGYDLRLSDLSGHGGPSSGLVAGHYLLQQTPDGRIEFFWSAWDHFAMSDWIEPYSNVPPVDFDHPNSLAIDSDSNFVVSWRQLGEVDKINSKTGALMWRLGGTHNQFQILNDPSGGFAAQHYVRILPNGNLLLFDNGTGQNPQESRAVEYHLDLQQMTATMVWEYRHNPAVYAPFVGSAQRLSNGNTVVGFGLVGRVVEVGGSGQVRWDAELKSADSSSATWFYRAIRVPSLYRYVAP